MDFAYSPRMQSLQRELTQFMGSYAHRGAPGSGGCADASWRKCALSRDDAAQSVKWAVRCLRRLVRYRRWCRSCANLATTLARHHRPVPVS